MDAPLYPAAPAYTAPAFVGDRLGGDSVSLGELLAAPETRDILLAEAPVLEKLSVAPAMRPHLGNFSVLDLMRDGAITAETVARIEARLRALPAQTSPQTWPAR